MLDSAYGENVYVVVHRLEWADEDLIVHGDQGVVLELHPRREPRLRMWSGADAVDAPVSFVRVVVRPTYVELELAADARDRVGVRLIGLLCESSGHGADTVGGMLARCLPPELVADAATHASRAAAKLAVPSAHERVLRAEVLRRPDDDGPRLVLADYWLERGDPRGELIALQCDGAGDPDRQREQARRADELLRAHRDAWLAPYDLGRARVTWARGFAERIEGRPEILLPGWRDFVAAMPVRCVAIWPSLVEGDALAELLNAPWPAHITALALYDFADAEHIEHVIASTVLPQIEKLYLSVYHFTYGDAHLDGLSANGRALRDLQLRCGTFSTAALARALAARSWRTLSLPSCELDATAGEAFAAATNQVELCSLTLGDNQLGDDGVVALGRAAHLIALRELDLSSTGIGPRGIRALIACRAMRALHLRHNNLGVAHAEALATLPAGQLLELWLDETPVSAFRGGAIELDGDDDASPFGDEGARALAGSAVLAELEVLVARGLGLSGRGARTLIAATRGKLARLDLGRNPLGPDAIHVATAPELATVHTLDLERTGFGDAAVEALAARTDLAMLRELSLGDNPIHARGARSLAASPSLPALERLSLPWGTIDEDSRAILRARFGDRVY